MSLNNIILPDLLVTHLYKDTLFSLSDNKPKGNNESTEALQYLGKHLQKITVLVHYANEVYLPEAQLHFLANILKACSLNIADIAIINLAKQAVAFEHLKATLGSRKMIFFETDPAAIRIDEPIPAFSVKQYKEISLLKAPALEDLNQATDESKLLKSKLWLCLKELFSVK